jgi:uncharacterized protein
MLELKIGVQMSSFFSSVQRIYLNIFVKIVRMSTTAKQMYPLLATHVEAKFKEEGSGHDWWHILRVINMARRLAREEEADEDITALAALLHDIADHKFHGGDLEVGPQTAAALLRQHGADESVVQHVVQIIREVSFKGAGVATPASSVEAACVQDADRLDAIGAIGVARAFAYGGSQNRLLYDPNDPPVLHDNFTAYSGSSGATINHFHEKLLLLRDRMHTEAARRIANERHRFMEAFLTQFHHEWEGSR